MSDVNAIINIDINSSSALTNLKKLESEINQFNRSVSASNATAAANQASLNRALLDGINNTGLFTAKQVSAIDSAARFSSALEKNKLTLGEYSRFASSQLPGMSRIFRREFDTMEQVATSRVKKMNAQYLALGRTVDGITKAIESTPTGLARGYSTDMAVAAQKQMMFNKLIDDGSTKLLNWGKNTQWAGRQLMVGLTLPLAAMGAASAKAFMEIDKASVALRRVYGDLSTTTMELETNVEAVKQLGSEYTKYGIAVSETIQIAARAAATGATNEKLMAATEQTLRFATLGQVDYNQALDTTIAMQTAFGISNEDLASSIDYLNAVENQTILTIEDMSLAIPRVATVIKGLGGDVQDLAVFMTAMREGGVSAENAANGLKSGLASMINPTKQASEYLSKFNINLEGIVNANEGNLVGTVQQFGRELDKLSDMDRQRALEKTFGKYQYARMSALFSNMANGSSQAARAMDLAGMSAEELASISEKELGKISESTTVKFQAALEQLKLSIAPIGEAFLKLATPVIEVVTKLADIFNSLPDPIKNAMGIATAAIAGLGPILLMGIGLMGNLVANIAKGIQWWRKLGARIRGDASAFTFMETAQLEANAATEALEGSTQSLTGKLQLQSGAVRALTAEYERFAAVAGTASGAMGRMGGGRRGGTPKDGAGPLRMATGGVVPGSGSGDKIPALLEPGETVVTKEASQRYGSVIAAMNAGNLPGYEFGKDDGISSLAGVDLPPGARLHGGSTQQSIEDLIEQSRRAANTIEDETKRRQALIDIDNVVLEVADKNIKETIAGTKETKKAAISLKGLRKALEPLNLPELITPSSERRSAAHLTTKQDLDKEGLAWLESRKGVGGKGKSEVAQRYIKLSEDPEMAPHIKQYSALTADLSQTLNTQLQTGAEVAKFNKEWSGEGSRLLPSLKKFGGFVGDNADDLKALSKFERLLSLRVNQRSDVIKTGIVKDEYLAEETERLIRDISEGRGSFKRASESLKRVASAADVAANTVGQVGVAMSREDVYERVKAKKARREDTGSEYRYIDTNTGVVLGREGYEKEGKRGKKVKGSWRPERMGDLARGEKAGRKAGRVICQSSLQQTRIEHDSASPSEEFAEVMDDAADGMVMGAERSKGKAAKAGKVLAVSARDAYKAESSQLRGDMRRIGMMEAGGMTDATQQTRGLRRAKRSRERPAIVAAGRIGKVQRQEEAQRAKVAKEERLAREKTDREKRKIQEKADYDAAVKERYGSIKRANKEDIKRKVKTGVNRGAGAMGMASMIPFMAQNEEGKFMGMDANMLGMGMMGASMAMPMIGPAMSGLATGATALAGAMGIGVAALAAPVAALAAVAATAWLLKKGMDNTIQAGRDYADAMTTSAKEQQSIADLFGTQTYADKRKQKNVEKLTGLSSKQQKEGKEFAGTDQGKAMVEDAKILLEKNSSGFVKNMATQLSQMVLSGAVNPEQAKVIASGISDELGRSDLTASITGEINQILAPNGKDVTNSSIQIQSTIKANLETDEAALEKKAKDLTSVAEDAFMGGKSDSAKLLSGDWDAAIEASIAYYNTVIANSASIYSSYLDQRNALKDQISELKNQIKQEDDKAKKIELQNELLKIQNELKGLDTGQKENVAERKQKEMSALRGNDPAQHSARLAIEEAGVVDTGALMHQMAMARERVSGQMTTDQRKEFELSFMVDLQSGRIDPAALQTLQISNERLTGQAESIVDTVVNLQATGDYETANQILALTAQMPDEVLTVFNAQIKDMSTEELVAYAEVMAMIPADVSTKIAVELSGMSVEDLKAFKENLESLQGLGIDTGDLIDKAGVDSIANASKSLKSMEDQLKKKSIQKGLKEINKIDVKDTKARAKKIIEVTTELQDSTGKQITAAEAQNAITRIIDSSGLNEKDIYALPADVATKVIALEVDASSYTAQAQSFRVSAYEATTPEQKAKFTEMADEAWAISQAFSAAAKAGAQTKGASLGLGGGTTPEIPEVPEDKGGGGGGAKENPLLDLKKTILEQIQMYSDMTVKMKDLNSAKTSFANIILKSKGIFDKLKAIKGQGGIDSATMQTIMDMGPEATKKWMAKNTKKNKKGEDVLTKEGQKQVNQMQANAIKGTITENIAAFETGQAQKGAYTNLRRKGVSEAVTESIAGDPKKAMELEVLQQKINAGVKDAKKLYWEFVNAEKAAVEQAELVARAQDDIQTQIDDMTMAHRITTVEIDKQIDKYQDQVDVINKEIDALQKINSSDQNRIRDLDRQKELINRQIEKLSRANELDQRRSDALKRQDEMRNRVADALGHELEIMSQQETKIKEAYDKRIKALDEVAKINTYIINQQKSQLGLAQALSEGDVYAAAAAAQGMQAEGAQFAEDQMRAGLQTNMENQIAGLRTAGGLTREDAEAQVVAIKEQSYQTSLLIRDIEDAIYQRNLEMIPLKDNQLAIDTQIQVIQDAMYARDTEVIKIQDGKLAAAQSLLDKEIELKNQLDKNFEREVDALELKNDLRNMGVEQAKSVNALAGEYHKVAVELDKINKLAKNQEVALGKEPAKFEEEATVDFEARLQKYRDAKKKIEDDRVAAAAAALAAGPKPTAVSGTVAPPRGQTGMLAHYAAGGVVGDGARDSVSAMLTPGEFVMRRASVEKYGASMLSSMNMGSFEMPRFNMQNSAPSIEAKPVSSTANISAPVYNTYSVSVNANTNASPDDIANKVMMKIKSVESRAIRSTNGY